MQQIILYQAYGSIDIVNECRYSILKLLQFYNLIPPKETGICIYTDHPSQFDEFQSFFHSVEIRELSPATIQEWKGAINFKHRVKVEMLIDYFKNYQGKVIYFDTDTFIQSPVESLFQHIENGKFLMHEYEGTMSSNTSAYFGKWEHFFRTTPVIYNNQQLDFSPDLKVWNAGVIGLNSESKVVLHEVLSLTDSIYKKFPKHIAEQFAFSYCFQKKGHVEDVSGAVFHYWNVKEFRTLLNYFFEKYSEESVPNLVKLLAHIDPVAIQRDKVNYKKLTILQKFTRTLAGKSWKIENYLKKI
ncbi:MAG TPA: hypothetical protein VM368_02890 [Flavisolibacter sp.]|nr:hypothetical protein [Flavisolibacter sp.]